MEEWIVVPILAIIFIGFPWLILHHVTKWKTAATLTSGDEQMLVDMYDVARKLEDRLDTVERLIAADNPNWSPRHIAREEIITSQSSARKLERNR
jgi:phage shock protein B